MKRSRFDSEPTRGRRGLFFMVQGTTAALEILVVDDNEDDVLLLQESFSDVPSVNLSHIARDGAEALAYLRREGEFAGVSHPDLVLLDINMPKMNGFELLAQIKTDPKLRCIPVIMLTTSTRDEDIARSYDHGASSFVSKPVNFDTLKEIVKLLSAYWTFVSAVPRRR